MSSEFVTNEQIVQEARRQLDQGAWDYLVGGSESETTMRRNRLAFDRIAFRPRVLVDVSDVDPSTTLLGHKMRIPVMLAPVGGFQRIHPEGGAAATRAAAEFGTLHTVSSVTEPTLEEIAATSDNTKFFQLYVQGDEAWLEEIIGRVKQAGYQALCLTVDNARYSLRERPMVHGTPVAGLGPRNPTQGSAVTWETMDKIKDMADMPFMVKGIATAEDAAIAVKHGVDVIWISNHGGRQLDHGLGTLEMLPEIVDAVGGKAEIVLDGGVVRGTDVVKALALGADVVAIGKLQGWGLGAAGTAGLVRVLEILEDEIYSAIALLGVSSVDQLTPDYLRKAEPVTPPHEMSAWVNMPEGRML